MDEELKYLTDLEQSCMLFLQKYLVLYEANGEDQERCRTAALFLRDRAKALNHQRSVVNEQMGFLRPSPPPLTQPQVVGGS